MSYHEELPGVVFLSGSIEPGDSFELRRAMRDQEVKVVVPASPGGNLFEGLQMASIINDNQLATYLPEELSCESACSIVFLGGVTRMALGQLGVHQFRNMTPDENASSRDVTAAATQYTTAEIIGIMNQFRTPPFVYEKMFSTTDIYYFKGSEKSRLQLGADDQEFLQIASAIDDYLARYPLEPPSSTVAIEPPREPSIASPAVRTALETPAAPPAEVSKPMMDLDFFGADILPSGKRNVSISECADACAEDMSCAAYSYVSEKRWCWHKSKVENLSYAPGVVSGVMRWEKVVPGLLDRPFNEVSGTDLFGLDIFPNGLKGMSLEQCRNACSGTAACVAFAWISDRQWCFPKHGIGQITDKAGVISGIHRSQLQR